MSAGTEIIDNKPGILDRSFDATHHDFADFDLELFRLFMAL